MQNQVAGPITITVPSDDNMKFDPAETIAKGQRLRNIAFTVAAILGYALPERLGTDLDWVIQAVVGLAALVYAWYTAWQQGQKTRDAVYSPASAAAAARATDAVVRTGPPEAARIPDTRAA